MYNFKIRANEWPILKRKLQRKYIHLTSDELQFQESQEEELLDRLATRLKRDRDYVLFTLSKELKDLDSNRLWA